MAQEGNGAFSALAAQELYRIPSLASVQHGVDSKRIAPLATHLDHVVRPAAVHAIPGRRHCDAVHAASVRVQGLQQAAVLHAPHPAKQRP